jgi:hypothetical protein
VRGGEDEELAEAELVAGDGEWVLRLEEGVRGAGAGEEVS